jgi:membrane protein required for colicin V production
MILDLVALGLLAVFAWRGAVRGALASGLSLLSFVLGNVAAWYVATRHADASAEALRMPVLLAAPIAGTLAFFAVALAIGAISWIARRRAADRKPSPASRVGGAVFGLLRGSVVVLLVGLLAVWADAMQRSLPGADPSAPADETPLHAATEAAVRAGVGLALGDTPGADLAANALARPAEALDRFRALAANPDLTALADDHALWSYVEAGAYDAALAQPSFLRLQSNAEVRHELAALGVVDQGAAGDPQLFTLEVRAALREVGPRLQALRDDPDVARLASDPAIADLLRRRDYVGLLAHPGFQRVLATALASPPGRG